MQCNLSTHETAFQCIYFYSEFWTNEISLWAGLPTNKHAIKKQLLVVVVEKHGRNYFYHLFLFNIF